MPRRLAQQLMTLTDLEWPFHALCTISAVAELLVNVIYLYIITVKSHFISVFQNV